MPPREAEDGGHTAFTDHRIQRRPESENKTPPVVENLQAWRAPPPQVRARNLALAFNHAGLQSSSSVLLARSYPLLLEVQKTLPRDAGVLAAIGAVLLNRNEAPAAVKLFEQALEIRPNDAAILDSAGMARMAAGEKQEAARYFERALQLDPLLLPDIEALQNIYTESGDQAKLSALMTRVRAAMITGPARPLTPR